jgi:ribose transport system substrate-binding protein
MTFSAKSRNLVYGLLTMLLLAGLLAACGGGATPAPTAAPAPAQAPEPTATPVPVQAEAPAAPAAGDDLLASLPAELQALYTNTTDPIEPSPFDDFAAVEGPWKICYADSYQGNPWRVAVRDELIRLAEEFQAAGKVESFENAVSNNDVAQQISNIRAYIDKGCDIILSIPESATGLNDVIKDAYDAGIPFVTMAGAVNSPYALNVNSNYYKWGYDMAEGIAKELDGKGNVLMVEGLAGHPIVLAEGQGYDDAMAQYPDLKTVARVNGDWTLSVTKQAVLQALATRPEPIDAVWTTGSESRVIAEAFAEAGRPVPLITGSLTGDIMGYWQENGDEGFRFYGHGVLPHWTAQTGFRAAVRLLEGQQPKLNLLEIPLPEVTQEDLPNWYDTCMTTDATSIFPIPPTDPFPEDIMNEYFVNGAATPPYDYATAPKACP